MVVGWKARHRSSSSDSGSFQCGNLAGVELASEEDSAVDKELEYGGGLGAMVASGGSGFLDIMDDDGRVDKG